MKPKKSLGQNFLTSGAIADRIVEAAGLTDNDLVLEIGPGTGILTERLIKTAKEVWAVEKDYDLVEKLRKNIQAKNLKLIHQDALWFDPSLLFNYKIVANIPYNITSPLIRKFLENEPRPSIMVLMVQKEVAERICAQAGDRDRGLLTIIVEFYADAEILFEVSRRDFYPSPEVDSAVVKFRIKNDGVRMKDIEPAIFFKIVKAGFAAKRRQIHNSLAATLVLDKDTVSKLLSDSKIDPMARAEDLTLDEWERLAKNYRNIVRAAVEN